MMTSARPQPMGMTAQQISARGQAAGWQPGQNAPQWYARQLQQGKDPFGEMARPEPMVDYARQPATQQQMAMKDAMNRQNSMQPMHVAQSQAMGLNGPSWLNGMQQGAQVQPVQQSGTPQGGPMRNPKGAPAAPPRMV